MLYRIPLIGQMLCPHEWKTELDIFTFCSDCGKNLGSRHEGRILHGLGPHLVTGKIVPMRYEVINGVLHELPTEEKQADA